MADEPKSIEDLDPHRFYPTEQIAPLLGIAKSTLRSYCRVSGIHTRVGKRMLLDLEDVLDLRRWIKERGRPTPEEYEADPFAPARDPLRFRDHDPFD